MCFTMVTMKTWMIAMVGCVVLYSPSSRAAECKSTGHACVRDCANKADGNYQSCSSCHVFIQCANHRTFVMPCPANLEWDDNAKRCVTKSNTCKNCDVSADLMDKPGMCPPPDPFGMCLDACKTDYDCPGPLKCCFNGCGTVCGLQSGDKPVEGTKPGQCPAHPPHVCIKMCSDDDECPGPTKCCSTGCGQVCLPPSSDVPAQEGPNGAVEAAEVTTGLGYADVIEHDVGMCPPNIPPFCASCTDDKDCNHNWKCCYFPDNPGCNYSCAPPLAEEDGDLAEAAVEVSAPEASMESVRRSHVPRRKHCKSTGPRCVDDCTGRKDGDYQSCHGCGVYVSCSGGRRYDDRPCAPGGLVWDDNKKRCEYNSSTCRGCLCPPPCGGTGPSCIRSCAGLPDGNYQSCKACNVFVSCSNGRMYEGRPCAPRGTVWDDNCKVCAWWSDTCHRPRN